MQDPQAIAILQIIAPAVIGIVFIIASATVAGTWFANRAKRPAPQDKAAQARIEEKLNQLTNSVDAIAIEVERISEGQRFTTKLLAEAATPSVPLISDRRQVD
jgi:hypothetical protein